ncbi:MAG: hypothetical protein O9318_08470 [Hylemonella sp.]|uniref:hypothetical protein n=1 Tax=Hylemonella sp. TaxID=2066020 RepID=UPI0022BE3B0B|nr:hypothetical protein [Hylemonella sp.]MCZ8252488.1 hypothetical protein [Hylemonella sp.]
MMAKQPLLRDALVLAGSFVAGAVIGYFIARLQGMDALAGSSAGLVIALLGGAVCLRLAWRLQVASRKG